jgi:hypothetical protein
MAEREGFEPSVQLPVHMISSHAPSTTRTPLRMLHTKTTYLAFILRTVCYRFVLGKKIPKTANIIVPLRRRLVKLPSLAVIAISQAAKKPRVKTANSL